MRDPGPALRALPPAPPLRKALGLAVPLVLGGALLAGCGAASPAGGAGGGGGGYTASRGAAGASATAGSGCQKGAAGTSAFTLAVALEPASGVAKPRAACWASIAYTGMNNPSVRQAPPQDSGQFKVAWDAQNLYVLAWVKEWPLNAANSGAMHKDDAVEFYVAGDNAKGNSRVGPGVAAGAPPSHRASGSPAHGAPMPCRDYAVAIIR